MEVLFRRERPRGASALPRNAGEPEGKLQMVVFTQHYQLSMGARGWTFLYYLTAVRRAPKIIAVVLAWRWRIR